MTTPARAGRNAEPTEPAVDYDGTVEPLAAPQTAEQQATQAPGTPDAQEGLTDAPESLTQVVTINAPCDWINSNHRYAHWAVKARLTKMWRLAAYALARNQLAIGALSYRTRPVDITVYVHKTTNRRYDAHNLMPTAKACIDGLVQAGVLEDDSNRYLRKVSIVAAARGEREYLELIIESADDGGAAC